MNRMRLTNTETTYQQRLGLARSLANVITQELKQAGFVAHAWHFSGLSTVDFHDEQLRRAVEKKILESKIYEDGLKAEQYAGITTRGSIAITASNYSDEILYEGDIPVSMIRPDKPIEPFIRAVISEWYPTPLISEVHLHMWDHKPAVHIHIKGSIRVTRLDVDDPIPFLRKHAKYFRGYIEHLTDISKTFLEEIEVK